MIRFKNNRINNPIQQLLFNKEKSFSLFNTRVKLRVFLSTLTEALILLIPIIICFSYTLCSETSSCYDVLHDGCIFQREPFLLAHCLSTITRQDVRRCHMEACNEMSPTKRAQWRMGNLCAFKGEPMFYLDAFSKNETARTRTQHNGELRTDCV